jgi:predicted FMN-binding regulatory protein PaiB
MYQPPHFREDDRATQIALIRAHPLGLLVTAEASGPVANLVPFLPVEEDGSTRLLGHVARANPQWKAIRDGAPVLVVFQGVDTYITPSWYETKRETGKVVPTWNYAVVQVRGRARAVEDRDWLRRQVGLITDVVGRRRTRSLRRGATQGHRRNRDRGRSHRRQVEGQPEPPRRRHRRRRRGTGSGQRIAGRIDYGRAGARAWAILTAMTKETEMGTW